MYTENYYKNVLSKILINQSNIYNINNINNLKNILITFQINTFKNEKIIKIIKIYYLLFFLTNQRPFLKKVKFIYIKKQILKCFFFSINLRKKNFYNIFFYFNQFYMYFFNIYYLSPLKYNYNNNTIYFYIDNINNQYKSYGKLNLRTQWKFIFINKNMNFNNFLRLLNNYLFIKIENKKNALFINKK